MSIKILYIISIILSLLVNGFEYYYKLEISNCFKYLYIYFFILKG
jgi:hypothetical protein